MGMGQVSAARRRAGDYGGIPAWQGGGEERGEGEG
jgi:hypothetical protein